MNVFLKFLINIIVLRSTTVLNAYLSNSPRNREIALRIPVQTWTMEQKNKNNTQAINKINKCSKNVKLR